MDLLSAGEGSKVRARFKDTIPLDHSLHIVTTDPLFRKGVHGHPGEALLSLRGRPARV
jgi:hypothetical protein